MKKYFGSSKPVRKSSEAKREYIDKADVPLRPSGLPIPGDQHIDTRLPLDEHVPFAIVDVVGVSIDSSRSLHLPPSSLPLTSRPAQAQFPSLSSTGKQPNMSDAAGAPPDAPARAIERAELHKALKALETILIHLNEYCETKKAVAKAEKKLSKAVGELAKVKAIEEVPSQALEATHTILETIQDVSHKQAKLSQKEYDALNDHCARYFKRIAKEERGFDQNVEALEVKIRKAHANYEKTIKKSAGCVIQNHDRYVDEINALTGEVKQAKTDHSVSIGNKTFVASLMAANALGGLADAEFKAECERVRKAGPSIGTLNDKLNLAVSEATASIKPPDLEDDARGFAQALAAKEAEIQEEQKKGEEAKLAELEKLHKAAQEETAAAAAKAAEEFKNKPAEAKEEEKPAADVKGLPKLDKDGNIVEGKKEEQPAAPTVTADAAKEEPKDAEAAAAVTETSDAPKEAPSAAAAAPAPARRSATRAATTDDFGNAARKESIRRPTATRQASTDTVIIKDTGQTLAAPSRDTRARTPTTPRDDQNDTAIVIQNGHSPRISINIKQQQEAAEETTYSKLGNNDRGHAGETALGNVERSCKTSTPPQEDEDYLRPSHTRDMSLWERQRERERQLEREKDLERRLAEAEARLNEVSRSPRARDPNVHYAMPSQIRNSPPRQQEQLSRDRIPSTRYEPRHYEPAVGNSRISPIGVTRTLSTDSERDFVARMRVRYQADKQHGAAVRAGANGKVAGSAIMARPPPQRRVMTAQPPPQRPGSPHSQKSAASAPSTAASSLHAPSCGCWNCSVKLYKNAEAPSPIPVKPTTSPFKRFINNYA